MFTADRITLQPIRSGLIPFNAAMVGFVEATRDDLAEKNRLCPPNRLPDIPLDWVRGTLIGMKADYLWSKDPRSATWLERARLNPSRGLRQRIDDRSVQQARNAVRRERAPRARQARANLCAGPDVTRRRRLSLGERAHGASLRLHLVDPRVLPRRRGDL